MSQVPSDERRPSSRRRRPPSDRNRKQSDRHKQVDGSSQNPTGERRRPRRPSERNPRQSDPNKQTNSGPPTPTKGQRRPRRPSERNLRQSDRHKQTNSGPPTPTSPRRRSASDRNPRQTGSHKQVDGASQGHHPTTNDKRSGVYSQHDNLPAPKHPLISSPGRQPSAPQVYGPVQITPVYGPVQITPVYGPVQRIQESDSKEGTPVERTQQLDVPDVPNIEDRIEEETRSIPVRTQRLEMPHLLRDAPSAPTGPTRRLRRKREPRQRKNLQRIVEEEADESSAIHTHTLHLGFGDGVDIPTQTLLENRPAIRKGFDKTSLLGTVIEMPDLPYDLKVTKCMAKGGMSYIYRAEAIKDGKLLKDAENLSAIERKMIPPPFVLKVCQDKCETDNEQLLNSARFIQELERQGETTSAYPKIFKSGELDVAALPGRHPSYLVTELLYPNPIMYLKNKKDRPETLLIPKDEGLHPQIALVILNDILKFIQSLHARGKTHNDLHIDQIMLRMSPLTEGRELSDYTNRLDNLQFETVIPDCDTIADLNKEQTKLYYTPGYADPWIIENKRTSRKKDAYAAITTFFAMVMGLRVQQYQCKWAKNDPHAGLIWIEHMTKMAPPMFATPDQEPTFTQKQVYDVLSKHRLVELPNDEPEEQSLWDKLRGRTPKAKALSVDQEHAQIIYKILNYGLAHPDQRERPISLHQRLLGKTNEQDETKKFRWESRRCHIYDGHDKTYDRTSIDFPRTFGDPNYSQRKVIQLKPRKTG